MSESTDRLPAGAGGRSVSEAVDPAADRAAVLALADGSVWRGWSVGPAQAVSGRVHLAGELVLVEGDVVGVLRGVDVGALGRHLASTAAGRGPGTMGYLAAPGAILPIHETVARAIAKGEIGHA